jgi:hypothetical protein
MQFYEVEAKCGHVGKNYYYRGLFYVRARDKKEAAAMARNIPRVKHDNKFAILNTRVIDYAAFMSGQALQRTNPYFRCKNIQDQKLILPYIENEIFPETVPDYKTKHSNDDRKSKQKIMRRTFRKAEKYGIYDFVV